ncbi:MAG: hypothetical protein JWQ21_926 [Herminiimonas sp.]|nr:hypothetical protein [Herminiimonas sp.]
MSAVVRLGRRMAIIALVAGYALLAHYTNTAARTETLGTLLALAPIVLTALSMARHSRHRLPMLAMLGIGCAALLMAWTTIAHHFARIYWLEHAGSQLVLCLVFGRTLSGGREPMCTRFARSIHGSLTPEIEHYTRQVTAAWVLFFGSMAAVSTILFFAAPLAAWSAFANFLTAPLIGLMFVAEYLVRRRLHPHTKHAHILDAIKVFWKAPAG